MRKRIKELEALAYKEVVETSDYNGMPSVELVFDKDKFADLIIADCIAAFTAAGAGAGVATSAQELITAHFGAPE